MGVTSSVKAVAMRWPSVASAAMRIYLRTVGVVPERFEWVVSDLKRELPLGWEQRVVSLPGGGQLSVNSASAVGREIYYEGTYEPELCRAFTRWLAPGMVCVDAGANIGEFTVRAARIVGPVGHVHAFEASPTTFPDLQANVALNRLHNVTLNQLALGAQCGERQFYLSRGIASGSSSLTPAHDFSGTVVKVPGTTLDDYVRRAPVPRIDFIKIDVEGAELDVLKGAAGLLSNAHAPVVVFEYHPSVARRFSVSKEDVLAVFRLHRYRVEVLGLSAGCVSRHVDAPENLVAIPPRLL